VIEVVEQKLNLDARCQRYDLRRGFEQFPQTSTRNACARSNLLLVGVTHRDLPIAALATARDAA